MSSHGASARAQSQDVYAAGLVQGIVLVTFPAASTIFTSAGSYGLSSSQYGAMFLPQAITAVGSSLLQGNLSRRLGGKPVYLAGLCANLAAMLLLIASRFAEGSQPVAYPLLLLATACLGAGFGLTVPSINTFTAAFHPDTVDRSVLVLNSLLGLGTALAPVFVAIFVGLGFWVGLPVLAAVAVTALLLASLRLPLDAGGAAQPRAATPRARIPAAFWLFAAFGVMYGFCETMNGNWSQLDLTSLKVSASVASLALTVFYQLGYGIAAFGVGPLRRAGLTLPGLYGVSAVVAVALGVLSLAVAHRRPSPRTVHPRPQPLGKPESAQELIS